MTLSIFEEYVISGRAQLVLYIVVIYVYYAVEYIATEIGASRKLGKKVQVQVLACLSVSLKSK